MTPSAPATCDLEAVLGALVREALRSSVEGAPEDADPVVRPSKFADYQVNSALPLAKQLGRSPRDIANAIAEHLKSRTDVLSAVDVAGPGFINCTFANELLDRTMAFQADDERLGRVLASHPQRVVVDYGSPNVAKEMHVGHLRSTIIGDAITRVLGGRGDTVIRQNHLGDWGTQFGMLIEHLLEDTEAAAAVEAYRVNDLEEIYRAARAHFEADDDFKQRARERVVALQSGDPKTVRLWEMLVGESKRHFDEVFARLGTLLSDEDYRGESMYNDMLDDTVAELDRLGLLREDQGALCTFPPGFTGQDDKPFPLIVRKSDGGYGYAATDLAALRYCVQDDKANRVLYVTDGRQAQHFAMIIAVGHQAGWLGEGTEAMHVPHGMVLGKDGKPFKTREGGTVRLIDLIEEATAKAHAVLAERRSDLDEAQTSSIANAVGIGAIKWTDLKNERTQSYVFDPEAMTSFDGNTGPYIQYAGTRARSVLRKAGSEPATAAFAVSEPAERELALHLAAYGNAVERVAAEHEPHHLCSYLYELAGRFSTFYENCSVLNAETEAIKASRLSLCRLTASVIEDGLQQLGITPLERM